MNNWLSVLIFLPIAAALILLLLPKRASNVFRPVTIVISVLQTLIASYLYAQYLKNPHGYHFVERADWINLNLGTFGRLNIDYFLAVDGLSIGLLLLSAFVMLIAAIASNEIKKDPKAYYTLFLLLSAAIMGVFCALDFFLFYVFYELMLLPMYFLIGMWGGPNREYASIKFFLYTLFGSIFMLLVMIGLYFSVIDPVTGEHTFNMLYMMDAANYTKDSYFSIFSTDALLFHYPVRFLGFIVLFIAFAIKIPTIPLHTWLPDAHVEAPTPVSIILAGVLLKIGGYGIIRICYGIFPEAAIYFSYWIGLIGVVSILYGAFIALASTDLKRMIAYSSISHMGFVILGIASLTSEGVNGAIFQMISHGVLSTMLFYLVGVIYLRVQDREIAAFRGLAQPMPRYTLFVVIAFFASLGLPGLSGFIGEAFTRIGAFKSASVNALLPRGFAILASVGILIGAAYFLWTLQRMFFGAPRFKGAQEWHLKLKDLTATEYLVLIPLALITILLGIFPSILFDASNNTINAWVHETWIHGIANLKSMQSLLKF